MEWKYGERIKYIREQMDMTQDDLAEKMEVGMQLNLLSIWVENAVTM